MGCESHGRLRGVHYRLRVSVQKSEVDLAAQFLAKGGTLGGAAARGNTSLALSHADKHETFLLTETSQTIDLPLSDKLLAHVARAVLCGGRPGPRINDSVGPHVLLSDRTRLNVVSTRTGAAINGTLVSTLAGTASVPLLSLFSTVDASEVAEGATGQAPRPNVAFTQIPIRYPNWESINATLGVCAPQIVRVAADGSEMTSVGALLHARAEGRARRAGAAADQVHLRRGVEDDRERRVRARAQPAQERHGGAQRGLRRVGLRARRLGQRHPAGAQPEVAEAVLHAAFAQELPGQHCHMLEALSVPSLLATTRYGKGIATGLSAVAAYAMPYRVDGTPADTPEGLKMFQSESWPCQGSVDFGRLADDCDGQANLANQFIEQAKGLKARGVDMAPSPTCARWPTRSARTTSRAWR